MNVKELGFRQYLRHIGFKFNEEEQYWYHVGNITILGVFDPSVNIFVDGDLTVTGYCSVMELTVTGSLTVNGFLNCTDLSAMYIDVKDSLYAHDIVATCDMFIQKNIEAKDIIVYGDLNVAGDFKACNVKYFNIDIGGNIVFSSLMKI